MQEICTPIVFSPHHDDAYWQAAGVSHFLKEQRWKVTFVTVIGEHYRWGGGREVYQRRAQEGEDRFAAEHVQLAYKSMSVDGADAGMAEEFCRLVRDLKPTLAITEITLR